VISTIARPLSLILAAGLAGCGGSGEPDRPAQPQRAAATATATPDPPATARAELGRPATVPGRANVFGAGVRRPPAPGDGGAGVAPTRLSLPAGPDRVVTFRDVTGRVNPITGSVDDNGAGGDRLGPTDVESYRGISGIVHDRNGMFLVGVFLTGERPARPAPPRIDFTRREHVRRLAPRVGQTFLIGNGKGRAYAVPARARRLYLGFADGYRYIGPPGWYDNNSGELSVTVDMRRR
jgi:hypothetical protein